jgi:hypothetical protein
MLFKLSKLGNRFNPSKPYIPTFIIEYPIAYTQDGNLVQWTLEPWESFEWSIDKWSRFLADLGADEGARKSVFLLAQLGEEGKAAANDVIWKCLKALAENTNVQNWSAFIHTRACNARFAISPVG